MLANFLAKHSVPKGTKSANWGSLKQGLFEIPLQNKDEFYELVRKSIPGFTQRSCPSLVFRPPKTKLQPVFFDVDLKSTCEVQNDLDRLQKLADALAGIMRKLNNEARLDCFIVHKDLGYWKSVKRQKLFCTGGHIYFPLLRETKETALKVRSGAVALVKAIYPEEHFTNGADDILDLRIPARSNGLMMLYDYKKGGAGGQYKIRSFGKWGGEKLTWKARSQEDILAELTGVFKLTYDYLWDKPEPVEVRENVEVPAPQAPKAPKAPKPAKSQVRVLKSNTVEFSVDEFLRALGKYIPDEAEWKQILCYVANHTRCNFEVVAHKLNQAWNSDGQFPECENINFLRNVRRDEVNKSSMVRILQQNVCAFDGALDENKIWPVAKIDLFNDIIKLQGRQVSHKELMSIFKNTFHKTWGNGDCRYLYRETQLIKKRDTVYEQENWVVSEASPFKKFDFMISAGYSLAELRGFVRKHLNKQKPRKNEVVEFLEYRSKSLEILEKGTETQIHELVKKCGLPLYDYNEISKVFASADLDGTLNLFYGFESQPYLYKDKSNPDILNIWPRNPLLDFPVDKSIKLDSTATWYWLRHIWARNDDKKFEWLCKYHHEKIANPSRKIDKILLVCSQATGSGKSSHQAFFAGICGSHCTIKFDDVNDIFKTFNAELLNRTLVYFDDVQRLNRNACEKLKTKTTETHFMYRKLYENAIKMPAYHDYMISANDKSSFYVNSDDRRVEIIEVSEEKAGDEQFWSQWYSEINDPAICKAWLDYFVNFKSDVNVRSKFHRYDEAALEGEKSECMKISHRFLLEFFADQGFYELGVDSRNRELSSYQSKFFENVNFKKFQLWVSKTMLYTYFKSWAREKGHQANLAAKTFEKQLESVGLEKSRIDIRGSRKQGYKLDTSLILAGIKGHYKFDASDQLEDEVFGNLEALQKMGGAIWALQRAQWFY